jgi:hypothetical protein
MSLPPLKTPSPVGVSYLKYLLPRKNPSTGFTEPLQGVLARGLRKIKRAVFGENSTPVTHKRGERSQGR